MSETIRAFIAIELNKETQSYLSNIQSELKETGADVKWVKSENIHLTLKFLGNIDVSKINQIKEILTKISRENTEFTVELSDIGAFPKKEHPRVIWIAIEKNQDKVIKIVADLEERLMELGIAKEDRPFRAHLTLGRVKSNLNRLKLVEKLKNINISQRHSLIVNKLTLFKSTLTPGGPIYEILCESNLKAS